jgi:hypothetical protein
MIISSKSHLIKTNKKYFFYLFIIIIVVFLFSAFLFKNKLYNLAYNNIIIRTNIKSLGIGGVNRDLNLISIIKSFSTNIFNRVQGSQKFETLIIDMNFTNYSKLEKNRQLAIKEGRLNKTFFNNVGAKLRVGEKKVRANLRLKGFYLDHVATPKWSFRVKVKNDNINGFRDFAIMNPVTRDFQSSPLIKKAMRYKGVITPRDKYYEVIFNGKKLGTMYLEERYTEDLTEYYKKPFGPIIYYDEKAGMHTFSDDEKFWNNDQNLKFIYSNIKNFENNPKNYINYIDQNIWAEYLAINFLFKCFHGNIGINLAYYFHPIDRTIQPISSDNSCGQKDNLRKLGFLPLEKEFIYKLIKIDSFKKLLKSKILWWIESKDAELFIDKLKKDEKSLRVALSKDSPFLSTFPIDNRHLMQVINWIDSLDNNGEIKENKKKNQFHNVNDDNYIFPVIEIQKKNNSYLLKINDYSVNRFRLKDLRVQTLENEIILSLEKINDFSDLTKNFNMLIKNKKISQIKKVEFTFLDLKNNAKESKLRVNLSHFQDNFNNFKNSSLHELKNYFSLDIKNKLFFLDAGRTIILEKTLVFPNSFDLMLKAGSSIKFRNNSGIVLNGGLRILGKKNNKVNLEGFQNEVWSGMLILAKGKDVLIDNLNMNGGNGIINGVKYRGAFTINKSNLLIQNSLFENNFSEDTLNLVQVKGDLKNITIQNSPSDGLDIDYGEVKISNSKFLNIGKSTGADAIDMSKSNVEINDIEIKNITDKGISIGEESKVKILNASIYSSFVGIVAKDSSNVIAKDLFFNDIIFADTMAYRKKPQFGGATMFIENLNTSLGKHLVQKKSIILINDKKIKPKKFDVDYLYKNSMRSIK